MATGARIQAAGREFPWTQAGLLGSAVAVAVLSFTLDLGPSRAALARDLLGPVLPWVLWPGGVMAGLVAASTAWRIVLWLAYRPLPAPPDADLPVLTVVVPAYNEGRTAFLCLQSILASDYPADRLRVVAVDDGSRDDTLAWMRRAAAGDDRAAVRSLPVNGGKRAALWEAFQGIATPVVVTVDSDTVLPPDALRALVAPLVADRRVGAVAGRVEALNRDANLLTRMLAVRYRFGFDFVRAYQSVLGGVLICPGALSAYRMDALQDGLPAWRHQRFLGAECRNGDDHALTNHVLGKGLRTTYQSTAVARTMVPEGYGALSRMYLRWARSNLRESLRYMAFSPRLLRDWRRWAALVDAVTLFLQIPLRLYLLPLTWVVVAMEPLVLLPALAAAVTASLLPVAVVARSERSLEGAWAVAYAVFSLLTLQWVYPLAALTVRSNRWLTR